MPATSLGAPTASAILFFLVIVALTLAVTWWAARRTKSTSEFYAAGRSVRAFENGLALAGDYMSAASFLGIAGLVALRGYDGMIYATGWLVGWPALMFLIAEPVRNLGKYTFADVVAFRMRQVPVRVASAFGGILTVLFYTIAQMVGAGNLIRLMFGIPYEWAITGVGAVMLAYVLFGGMLATTWVQIIKAVLLLFGVTLLTGLVLAQFDFSPWRLYAAVADRYGATALEPGGLITDPLDAISLGLALMLGLLGLPHILMRFYTVRDARAARTSRTAHRKQLPGVDRSVRVAQSPELLWIAERARRYVVDPLALGDEMGSHVGEAERVRAEAPPQVRHRGAAGDLELAGLSQRVAAGCRKARRGQEPRQAGKAGKGRLLVHGMLVTPRSERAELGPMLARASRACSAAMKIVPPRWRKPRSSTLRTRRPRETFARIGLSARSNASSTIDSSVTRTGRMRRRLQTKSGSEASIGAISSVPAEASRSFAASWSEVGLTMPSSAASAGPSPWEATIGWVPGSASWSAASSSASSLMVSTAGPLIRSASERSAVSPTPFTWRVRLMVWGLYCRTITRLTAAVPGSTRTRPARRNRGEITRPIPARRSRAPRTPARRARPPRTRPDASSPRLVPLRPGQR